MFDLPDWMNESLVDRQQANLIRKSVVLDGPQTPHTVIDGKPYVAFCSNDYLGLADNQKLHHQTCEILAKNASHATKASMLVNGYHQIHKDFEDNLNEGVSLSYLPDLNLVKLRLSFSNKEESEIKLTYEEFLTKLPKDAFITKGDFSLARQLGNRLEANNLLLGVAESCTGGFLSHLITSEAGSSHYFMGSLVSYAYDVKSTLLKVDKQQMIRDGAVSEETVHQMAKEVNNLLGTHCGIAISGIAGPGGATEGKPVGLVWFGLQINGKHWTFEQVFNGDRAQVRLQAIVFSLKNIIEKIK